MRVLLVSLTPFWGGGERYLEAIAAGARASGWRVVIAARQPRLAPVADRYIDLSGWATSPALLPRLGAAARAEQVALVHANGGRANYLLSLLPLAPGVRRLATQHTMLATAGGRGRQALVLALLRIGLAGADRVIAVSEPVRAELPPQLPAMVIPNGVPGPVVPAPLPARPVALFAGRLAADKGIADALAVAATGVPLVVAGDGPERDAVVAAGADWRGFVTDLAPLWRETSLLLLPSRAEGMPLAVLEGFAWGRPVVGYDVPGVRDVVTDGVTGRLVPRAAGAAGLAAAVHDLFAAPARLAAMAAAARAAWVADFRQELMVERTLALYRSLL